MNPQSKPQYTVCVWYVNGMSGKSFVYSFPSVRGVQAGREYFVAQCPIRLLPKIFSFTDAELPAELRAQRALNSKRIPEIANYVNANRGSYTFSAITASIDGKVEFLPASPEHHHTGTLTIGMDSKFVINDGQHRHAALKSALELDPTLGDETIAVVFFIDVGLERCQQMFADLNRHSVKPSASIGILYDHREPLADLTRKTVRANRALREMTELEKSTLAPKSRKLFTLSAVHQANQALLATFDEETFDKQEELIMQFWAAVLESFPEWRQYSSAEIRQDYISAHGTVLHALGRAANNFLRSGKSASWRKFTEALKKIDWSKQNIELWEGRALQNGHVSKSNQSVSLTTSVIKAQLGLQLTAEEIRLEEAIKGGKRR